MQYYTHLSQLQSAKDPGVVLVHSSAEKAFLEDKHLPNQLQLLSVTEQQSPDKNYAAYGKKYFLAKESTEFYHFMNQVGVQQTISLQPIPLLLDMPSIKHFTHSLPLPFSQLALTPMPPFASLP